MSGSEVAQQKPLNTKYSSEFVNDLLDSSFILGSTSLGSNYANTRGIAPSKDVSEGDAITSSSGFGLTSPPISSPTHGSISETREWRPRLFSDRFVLNKTLGYFHGLNVFVRLEFPNYLTEDRRERIEELVSYSSKFNEGLQPADNNVSNAFPLGLGGQVVDGSSVGSNDAASPSILAIKLLDKFRRTGFRKDLEEGLRVGQLALSNLSDRHEERGVVLLVLGLLLSSRFKFTKDTKDLGFGIKCLSDSMAASPTSQEWWFHESRIVCAVLLTTYFCEIRSEESFKSAIVATTEAVHEFDSRLSSQDSYFALSACSAILHGERFYKDPSPLDWIVVLESCIQMIQDNNCISISHVFKDEPYRRQILNKMEMQLSRFHVVIEDLDKHRFPADCGVGVVSIVDVTAGAVLAAMWEEYSKRIRKVHPAVALAEIFDPNYCISIRYDIRGEEDINRLQTTDGDASLDFFGLTIVQLRLRLLHLRVTTDPTAGQKASGSPEAPPRTVDDAMNLSEMYSQKYKTSHSLDHLSSAIRYAEVAFELQSELDEDKDQRSGRILNDLVSLCYIESKMTNTLDSLNRVIHYTELDLADVGLPGKQRCSVAAILADSSRQAVLLGLSLDDFDRCIDLVRATLEEANASKHDRLLVPVDLPYMLAMCLKTRYQSKGEPKDLDDCIRLFHVAISFPSLTQEDTVSMFNNYGLTLRLRYKRTRNLEDLDLAAEYLEKALGHMGDPRSRLSALNTLLLIFQDRHATTGEMEDIRLAIRYGEEALSSADQTENRIKSGILINLANALTVTGDHSDLDRAVGYARKAVALDTAMQSGHQAPLLRSDASDVLLTRYKAKQQDDDLSTALAFSEEASKLIRQGHSAQGSVLLQLGACLSAGDPSKIPWRRVVGVYTDAWQCASSLPVNRIFAASKAATILTANNCFTEAADLLERAVKLMPTIDSRWTKKTDLEGLTAASLALPADAAMVTLKAGSSAETALSLLEMGRGRTLGSLLDLRTEVSSSEDPDGLIRSFNLLRMKADAARAPSTENELRQQTARLLMDIRQRPGLEYFMYPPTPKDYMKQATAGLIVVVTTSAMVDTGMAIIITSSRIYSLPLINLTHAETTKQLREMSEEVTSGEFETYSSRNKKMIGLLGWLWDVIVKPVIEGLRLSKQLDTEKLPHIRWIGIGLLATAPLHVAGEYGVAGASESTMDYAVSSYAPSLRALLYAAERSPREYLNQRKDTRVLIVKMSETDGASPLQNVVEEAATLKGLAQSVSMQTMELDAPTTSDVLSHLPLHNIVHFACHGVSDPGDPSKSHLLLSDGALSVEKILKTHSAAPDVAFLSACSTAESHDARVVDESIHIASAFMMVGFKHIIGTLWEGSDKACMEISNRFYTKLFEENEEEWDGSWKVALALHHAIRQLQKLHPRYPLLWAPFVAFGP